MNWSPHVPDGFRATSGGMSLIVRPKGDGRWTWEVYKEGTPNPAASGVARSMNAAKRTVENYVERSPFG